MLYKLNYWYHHWGNLKYNFYIFSCFWQIFRFLLRLRHISWVLEENFHHLKKEAKARPELLHSPQYHRLQLYRHEMMHFVHTLQNYVTATVLQGSWVELLQNLQKARTLDDLYRMHVSYVKMVLFRLVSLSLNGSNRLMNCVSILMLFSGMQVYNQKFLWWLNAVNFCWTNGDIVQNKTDDLERLPLSYGL